MKNIEKIAIDSITSEISKVKAEEFATLESLKSKFEEAKKNYIASVNPLTLHAKKIIEDYKDELSPEAISYYETSISTMLKTAFKL